ncbi:EF-hand domain-containing protein [Nonomuraea sp. NPDC050404]|uniref:EF-hand domain-containing protein n=1 Tax=Nonomuraea sp. NPDC050404 TaxID=3155783 RepID=UPI0033D588F6
MSDVTTFRYGRTFDLFDVNGNNAIGSDDMAALATGIAQAHNLPDDSAKGRALRDAYRQLWEILRRYADADANGRITRDEFIEAMGNGLSSAGQFTRSLDDAMDAEFAVIDANDDGRIDQAELRAALESAGLTAEEAGVTAGKIDADGDDVVSREEYRAAWTRYYLEGDPEVDMFLGGSR